MLVATNNIHTTLLTTVLLSGLLCKCVSYNTLIYMHILKCHCIEDNMMFSVILNTDKRIYQTRDLNTETGKLIWVGMAMVQGLQVSRPPTKLIPMP